MAAEPEERKDIMAGEEKGDKETKETNETKDTKETKETNETKEDKTSLSKQPIRGLPTVIDVGGQIFDLESETNVRSGFFGRQTFDQTFHPRTYGDLPVEYLLRTYLPIHQTIKDIEFNPGDDEKLMKVLKLRAGQLRTSQEYQSSVVKNIPIQRYYLRILEIMDELRKGRKEKKVVVPSLSENDIFQVLLEIAWYLAHPAAVPKQIEDEWKIVLERLRGERLGDIVKSIRDLEKEKGIPSEEEPLRYFKKLDMKEVLDAQTMEDAKALVQQQATLVEAKPIPAGMRTRFEHLLRVLQMKGFIDEDTEKNEDGLPIVKMERLEQAMADNPLASTKGGGKKKGKEARKGSGSVKKKKGGGVSSVLSLPLGQAILPLFHYFRMLYDPVYSMLEQASSRSVKRGIFPHLLVLLHLCNEFHTPPAGKKMEYGLYHLKNIPDLLVRFLSDQLKETEDFINGRKTQVEQVGFKKQLFQLPRVRLRTLLRNNGGLPTMANEQHSIFHIQFFVVGQNLSARDVGEFQKKSGGVDSKVGDVIRETWKASQVFLAFTDAGTTTENIPFRFFEINYEDVHVNETGITVGQYSAALDALRTDGPLLKEQDAYLDKLADMNPFAVYNDAELALSTFLAMKEHMPK